MVDIVLMQLGCIKIIWTLCIYFCVCIEIVVSCIHHTGHLIWVP